ALAELEALASGVRGTGVREGTAR
ncbi:MAG: hypothetical protein JWR30_2739, partial [Conexibacter sp.]|nr:hypothetical protein [Conexibacter sp.]